MATAASPATSSAPLCSLSAPEIQRQVAALRRTDNYTNWYYLTREYFLLIAIIGGTIAFYYFLLGQGYSLLWSIPVTLLCIVCVGAGQHRLATLTHEASHYMLFKNRRLNEFVSEWFCMFPILGTTHSYRVQHLGHHQFPNDPERDPDWAQMTLSGHKYKFPMSRGRFLWECLIKQLLWPPSLIRYVLVRAAFRVDRDDGTPYRMIRRENKLFALTGLVYLLAQLACVATFVALENWLLLAVVPPILYLARLSLVLFAPTRWFEEYAVKSDIPVRVGKVMRLTFNTLLVVGIGWATALTGMPWWLFYILLWLVPLGTSFSLFMILRQLVQHGNADRERFTNTRVFEVHPLLSMAIFPLGNDYHLPHHLFPMVPHYNIRKLHALLMETEEYRAESVMVEGYFFPPVHPQRNPTVVDLMTK